MIKLNINGTVFRVNAHKEQSLLSVLRDELDLTGAKYGCGEGQCGTCTVLVDGVPTRSCITRAGDVTSKPITTIEGLEYHGTLHPVQQAFLEADALQCGYCAAGMILSTVALLQKNPNPTRGEIVRVMNGHICRCGVYGRIITAIMRAAKQMREAKP